MSRGLTPWDMYKRKDAELALRCAKKAFELAKTILMRLRTKC